MSTDQYFGSFMDDYFAECEEHVGALKRAFLAIEQADAQSPLLEEHLRAALRSLHTIKGLSGMVGFAEAERIAHAMEDWVRAEAPEGRFPDDASLEPMFDGAATLERALAARRAGGVDETSSAYLERLAVQEDAVRPGPAPAPAATAKQSAAEAFRLSEARARGAVILELEFVPSADLVSRGVGVETVRSRISAIGEIIQVTPRVVAGQGVCFHFLVALAPPGEVPPAWAEDAITWRPHVPVEAPEPVPAASPGDPALGVLSPANVVRVDLSRLDELMRLVGELVVVRSRLDDAVTASEMGRGPLSLESVAEINAAMERQLRGLREGVMRVRLVPVGDVFERMRFVVRDLARDSGKQVHVVLEGQEIEIDKLLVERMMEPILHLVRNAISHGIEAPEQRAAAGKPAAGTLRLRARAMGERVRVEVSDDGAGIDRAGVARRARAAGMTVPPGRLDDEALLAILSSPGFSTRAGADRASGRGVGMDVVRSTVQSLGGSLSLSSEPGQGTTFVVELPLTLMIVDALMVQVGDQVMAVPQPALLEVVQVSDDQVVAFENNEVLSYRGVTLPLVRLRTVFALHGGERPKRSVVLVVGSPTDPSGVLVDRVTGIREIVVRPLADPLVAVPGVSGATELGDGRVCLILDAAALGGMARRLGALRPRARPSRARLRRSES